MATVTPFRALRPRPEFASRVAAPPYDVLSLEEARAIAAENPHSFLRVSRAELEFSDDADPYSDEVYVRGADNLRNLVQDGILTREEEPLFCVYRQRMGTHEQTGLVALASIDEYDRGVIRKHEHTRPAKETDRVRIIETHESQSGPVLLFFRKRGEFDRWMEKITLAQPDVNFVADDRVEHTVWSVRERSLIDEIVETFRDVDSLYIADGHHRSAAASRARARRGKDETSSGERVEDGFLAVIFPHDQLQILPYNRVVRDLNGLTPADFVDALSTDFALEATSLPGSPPTHGFDMYLNGRWYRAEPRLTAELQAECDDDPTRALAVSVLGERVLDPILGISDQRSDSRIDFVGGAGGPESLAEAVNRDDWAVGFWLYPTTVEELMAVSDAGSVMPPKSTWFEPKLRDGLFVHLLRRR